MAKESELYRLIEAGCADDFTAFARSLIIPSAEGPVLFDDVMRPFQREAFEALGPSLKAVRDGDDPPIRRFWIERTKKASKDMDLAIALLWLMAFPHRPLEIQVCASKRDQAANLKRRIETVLFCNPWVSDRVRVVQNRVVSEVIPLAVVKIEGTDTGEGTHGPTPDVIVLNELVHVKRWSVMETHMANAAGVPRGIVIIATNAGHKGTPAERWREEALASKGRWWVQIWDKPAPWLKAEDREEMRRLDPTGREYARLFEGAWQSGRGDAVDEEKLDECFVLPGPQKPRRGLVYVAGLDLGITHDHSAVAVLGVDRHNQRVYVSKFEAWEPSLPTASGKLEVDVSAVERTCVELWREYGVTWFGYDPAAGGYMLAQRLRRLGVPMVEVSFSGHGNLTAMATAFVSLLNAGKLKSYDTKDGRLRRDFGKFQLKPLLPSGYRLVAVSDEWGHADIGTAVVLVLPTAVKLLEGVPLFDGDLIYEPARGSEEQRVIEGMPDEFRRMVERFDLDDMGKES